MTISAAVGSNESFVGWLVDIGPPFKSPKFIANNGYSKVVVGPNGCGKTKLLDGLRSPRTVRLFRRLPVRLRAPLIASREAGITDPTEIGKSNRLADDMSLAAGWSDEYRVVDEADDLLWSLQVESAHATLSVVSAGTFTHRYGPWYLPSDVSREAIETWTFPDEVDVAELFDTTRAVFQRWVASALELVDAEVALTLNPLVGRTEQGIGVSLLDVSEAFAGAVAARSGDRVFGLVGFALEIRITPEDGFRWDLRMGGDWFGYEAGSSAIRRWVALAAAETLREFELVAAASAQFREGGLIDLNDFIKGKLPRELIPVASVEPFALRNSWIMMDEPEIHLFGSESQTLGGSLGKYSESGRMAIVTHSLELASRLVGQCEFLNFTEPGVFESAMPGDWMESQLSVLSERGPAGLSGVRVLYVEGIWDVRILEHLFSESLREAQVILSPMHGVSSASACVTSVWQRLVAAPFGVMFDALDQAETSIEWSQLVVRARGSRAQVIRELRSQAARPSGLSNERLALLRLQANILEARMETRLGFVMHGLSDIFQVIGPKAYGGKESSWSGLGLRKGESFKSFVHKRFGVNLENGADAAAIFDRLTSAENLQAVCEPDAIQSLTGTLSAFLGGKN